MKLKNKLFSVAAAGMLVFSNVSTAVVSANDLTTISQENQKAIYSSQPGTRTVQTYSSDTSSASTAVNASNVTVTNAVKGDVVEVTGLTKGDVVKVYSDGSKQKATKGTELGKGTANSDGKATIKIKQIGEEAGTIVLTNTSVGKTESSPVTVNFSAEPITATLSTASVANYTKSKDTVTVNNLPVGTIVQVYAKSDSTRALGKATVKAAEKGATSGTAVVSVTLPGDYSTGGSVFVTATEKDKRESGKLEVSYEPAEVSKAIDTSSGKTTVINNTKSKDVITITGQEFTVGDVIQVYATSNKTADTKPIAKATVKAPKGATKGTTTVDTAEITLKFEDKKVTEIDDKGIANLYITRTEKDKQESERKQIKTTTNFTSGVVSTDKTTLIINDDEKGKAKGGLFVYGLDSEDEVLVYNTTDFTANPKPIGKAKVAKGESQVYVKLSKLTNDTNEVYVRLVNKDKLEGAVVTVSETTK